jgi:hypothetical protein
VTPLVWQRVEEGALQNVTIIVHGYATEIVITIVGGLVILCVTTVVQIIAGIHHVIVNVEEVVQETVGQDATRVVVVV